MRRNLTTCVVAAVVLAAPAHAIDAKAPESCATGPIVKTYGGTQWLVASCSDGKSLVFVAKAGSPAAPFEFDLIYSGDGYDLNGQGTGNRKSTDAAYADLRKLTGPEVQALLLETRQVIKP